MDKTYADTVRLLLAVAPDVFTNDIFAMKGGTAINLFVRASRSVPPGRCRATSASAYPPSISGNAKSCPLQR